MSRGCEQCEQCEQGLRAGCAGARAYILLLMKDTMAHLASPPIWRRCSRKRTHCDCLTCKEEILEIDFATGDASPFPQMAAIKIPLLFPIILLQKKDKQYF